MGGGGDVDGEEGAARRDDSPDGVAVNDPAGGPASIALVADSTCDLPGELCERLGLVRVPLTVVIGDRTFRDGVDLSPAEFYERLRWSDEPPTSSQPAPGDFRHTYERLLESHWGIVSIHISAALSGTVQVAEAVARDVDPARVRVIDSCSVSVGAGLLIEEAGALIAAGADLDEVEKLTLEARARVAVYGTVRSLGAAVRGGRVSRRTARLIEGLHLHPVISFDAAGRATEGGVAAGFQAARRKLAERAELFAAGAPARAMVVHSDARADAARLAADVAGRLGLDDVPVVEAGPVLTTHVGLGSVTVAVRRDRRPGVRRVAG